MFVVHFLLLLSFVVDEDFSFVGTSSTISISPRLSFDINDSVAPSSVDDRVFGTPSSAMSPISVHLYCQMLVKKPVPQSASFRSFTACAVDGAPLSKPQPIEAATNDRLEDECLADVCARASAEGSRSAISSRAADDDAIVMVGF